MMAESGKQVIFQRCFTQSDFDRFATLSGDDNPIHVDPEFSRRSRFGRTVAHGMLLFSTICGGLSRFYPGHIQASQELLFPSPTYAGETVSVALEVIEEDAATGRRRLSTFIRRPGGETGCQGEAVIVEIGRSASLYADPKGFEGKPANYRSSGSEAVEFKGLQIGQSASTVRTFTQQDLREYADLTGDDNPLYTDPDAARRAGFDGVILPGPLLGGMISYLLGTHLPGRGTNWLKQKYLFLAPAYPDQEITARVEIVRLRPEKQLVNLGCLCSDAAGEAVCVGESLVLVEDLEG